MIAPDLADWAVGLALPDIPATVAREALRHMLDGLGNAVAARRLGHGTPALQVARSMGGPAQAQPIGDTQAIGSAAAAFANGVLIHALDFDDTHAQALVHPTAVVVPAALAVAQETGADGARTLTAIVAGLEVACRLGSATPHGFHDRGLHATAVVGPPAAAVTAALLYGADRDVLIDAIGIAASSSGGLLEFLETGSNTKTLHPGSASLNGLLAAKLALAGASGPVSALDGDRGLYHALADREPNVAAATGDLGSRWEAAEIGIKPYPSCQLMHSALDAVALAWSATADIDSVESVSVGVHPDSLAIVAGEGTGQRAPRTTYDAKFDLPWSVAAALHDGDVTVDTYTPESIARQQVADTAAKVSVYPVADDRAAADVGATVTISRRGSVALTGVVQASRGSRGNPLSDDAVLAKFTANCGGGEASKALAQSIFGLDDAADVSAVLDAAAALLTN